jgi:hypothetical protein
MVEDASDEGPEWLCRETTEEEAETDEAWVEALDA